MVNIVYKKNGRIIEFSIDLLNEFNGYLYHVYRCLAFRVCTFMILSFSIGIIADYKGGIGEVEAKKTEAKSKKDKQKMRVKKTKPKKKRRRSRKRIRKKRDFKKEPSLSLSSLKKSYDRALKKKALKDAKVGYILRRLDTGETLLEHQADVLFHPASNTKVVTTAAAYKILGPNERFVTRWYLSDVTNKEKVILYWRASGDPKIVPKTFEEVAKTVKSTLIKQKRPLRIDELIIDDEGFTQTYLAPGYDQKPEDDAAYRAPNGGVGFQFNRFTTSFKPSKNIGKAPIVSFNPSIPYFQLNNKGKTNRKGKEKLQLSAIESSDNQSMMIKVGGTIPRKHKRVSTARRVGNPIQFAGQSLLYYLTKKGIRVGYRVLRGQIPKHLQPIKVHKSPIMSSLIKDINVYSNNYMAEQLLLAMGMRVRGVAGWRDGVLVVKSYLDAIVGIHGYSYVNGSGLFGEIAFSPRMLTDVLIKAYQESSGEFRDLLPRAGKEGTLKKRLRKLPRGAFNGKTGTLDQVSTLCGYLTTRESEELVLCLMMNDYLVKTWSIRSAQDELVSFAWLLRTKK
jgi:serine-type D-Ala-D-Ala carboxypeptidase/endopeptidase (penicillin-binding protein 4)